MAAQTPSITSKTIMNQTPTGTQRLYKHRDAVFAWIILTPVLLYFFIFNIIPVILNLIVSFMSWNAITPPQWIGPANYARFLSPPYPAIVLNTALFAVLILVFQTTVAFFVALLLNQNVIGRGFFRALWYIPTLTSGAIMAQIVLVFINPYGGVLNDILASLGQPPVIWTINPTAMIVVIIIFSVWRGLGGPIVLFLAALGGIHREIYEAAEVDGAGKWALLRYITIPLLRPMIVFVVITSFIGNFQILEPILLISEGGPSNRTNVMLLQIYRDAFTNQDFGLASAGGMIMTVILLAFSFYVVRALSREQREEGVS